MNKFVKPLIAAALGFALLGAPAFAAPVVYNVDSSHTSVLFSYAHNSGLSHMNGKFMNATGTVTLDEAAPANSAINVSFDLNGINTGVPALDTHIKSADMFDVAKYPTATFKSTKVEVTGKDTARVTGDFTLHGVTKPIVLNVKLNKITDDKKKAGFSATATVKRSDFGVGYGVPVVSDQIDLTIDSELALPAPAK